jgi:hypothetical protein
MAYWIPTAAAEKFLSPERTRGSEANHPLRLECDANCPVQWNGHARPVSPARHDTALTGPNYEAATAPWDSMYAEMVAIVGLRNI